MKLLRCSCRHCRRGLRTKYMSEVVTKKVRKARRKAKQAVKHGEEPETRVKVGYTD